MEETTQVLADALIKHLVAAGTIGDIRCIIKRLELTEDYIYEMVYGTEEEDEYEQQKLIIYPPEWDIMQREKWTKTA